MSTFSRYLGVLLLGMVLQHSVHADPYHSFSTPALPWPTPGVEQIYDQLPAFSLSPTFTGDMSLVGLEVMYEVNGTIIWGLVPAPFNTTVSPGESSLVGIWSGAACVTYNLTANSRSLKTSIIDFGSYYSNVASDTIGSPCFNNCSQSSTVALDPSGFYAFDASNAGDTSAAVTLSYELHAPGSPSCDGTEPSTSEPLSSSSTDVGVVADPAILGWNAPVVINHGQMQKTGSGATIALSAIPDTSSVYGFLNVTLLDKAGNVSLAVFNISSTVNFLSGGIDQSWAAESACMIVGSREETQCSFFVGDLNRNYGRQSYSLYLIYEASDNFAGSLAGTYTTALQGSLSSSGTENYAAPAAPSQTWNRYLSQEGSLPGDYNSARGSSPY